APQIGLAVPQALPDRSPAVELPAGFEAQFLEFAGLQLLRPEADIADSAVRIKPPPRLEQPSLPLQAVVERRAWEGHEMVEAAQKQLLPARELDALLDDAAVVIVVPKDERSVARKPVVAEAAEPLRIAPAGQVPVLAHVAEIGRVQGFHADEHLETSA